MLETAPFTAGPGASLGELEIEDGGTAGESEGELARGGEGGEEDKGESAGDGEGGEGEDPGVDAVSGEGEIAGAEVVSLGEGAGEIRLPPALDGAGAGD